MATKRLGQGGKNDPSVDHEDVLGSYLNIPRREFDSYLYGTVAIPRRTLLAKADNRLVPVRYLPRLPLRRPPESHLTLTRRILYGRSEHGVVSPVVEGLWTITVL